MGSCSKNSHKETRRYSMMAVFNSFFLFLGIILLFTHCQAVQCPPGAKPFGSKCYRFVKQSLNWNDARTLCKALHPGGMLATIDSEAENNFVFGLMSGNMAWIGLNDVATEGKMVWADRGGTPTYTNWNYNQPDNSGGIEDCVHILAISAPPKQWNDFPCDRKQPFVCEFPSEPSSVQCPPEAKPIGSKCYRFVKQSLNWNDARTLCKALHPGGMLATIDSEAENNFVFGLMSGNMAWIRLNDVATEGKMVWADRAGTPT